MVIEGCSTLCGHQCLVTALDHSNADHLNIILDVGTDGDEKHETPLLKLPPRALRFFADVLRQMAKQEPMLLVPQKHELTTQEAANFLNVSRPFVIKEIEANCQKRWGWSFKWRALRGLPPFWLPTSCTRN
jgi:hypothetical protein